MAGTRVGDIVGDVITEISQVPGVATQVYSQDRIRQFVQNAWLMEIEEMWWPQYRWVQTVPVVGGLLQADIVGPINSVDDWADIQSIFPEGSNRKIRERAQSLNPAAIVSGGMVAWYATPDYSVAHRPFRIWPDSMSGNIVVVARQMHDLPMTSDTIVYLDRLLLMYDACWMYTVDDGTVPAQVNKFQMLAGNRRKKMIAGQAQQPLELDPRFPADDSMIDTAMTDWFTVDQDPLA